MKILFRAFLSADKRRRWAVKSAVRLLRLILDVEKDKFRHYSDKLDSIESDRESVSRREYLELEEGYSNCEYALGFLDCAIDDLESAY